MPNVSQFGNKKDYTFSGGHSERDTPVPIPNTVVKPPAPMVLGSSRESRSLPGIIRKPALETGRAFSFDRVLQHAARNRSATAASRQEAFAVATVYTLISVHTEDCINPETVEEFKRLVAAL